MLLHQLDVVAIQSFHVTVILSISHCVKVQYPQPGILPTSHVLNQPFSQAIV